MGVKETKQRDYALDLLKILSILVVFFGHYERAFDVLFDHINFGNGNFNFEPTVDLLFMISGYFAFSSIRRIQNGLSFKEYCSAKLFRLLPLSLLCTLWF